MQTELKSIYKELSEGDPDKELLYKKVGDFVFESTQKKLKEFDSLVVKLPGIGIWFLRKSRLELVTDVWTDRSELPLREDFESDITFNNHLEKHLRFSKFKSRLEDYKIFIEKKKKIKSIRRELIPPIDIIEDLDEKFISE